MQLEPGMRVRCVAVDSATEYWGLKMGRDYIVDETGLLGIVTVKGIPYGWYASRFKPVFRVKMGRA